MSKTLMYDFHYNYILPKYDERTKLLFTDTDSLAYEIRIEDFYKDIAEDIDTRFDTSDYPVDHFSHIKTGINKKVIGMFKDEAGGRQIEEFVGFTRIEWMAKIIRSAKALRNMLSRKR